MKGRDKRDASGVASMCVRIVRLTELLGHIEPVWDIQCTSIGRTGVLAVADKTFFSSTRWGVDADFVGIQLE